MTTEPSQGLGRTRIRVFIDHWNFQLTMHEKEAAAKGVPGTHFNIAWDVFPRWVAGKAGEVAAVVDFSYEGAIVYASYNPESPDDRRFRDWAARWLNRQPGIQVDVRERRRKLPPRCPACHQTVRTCPHCAGAMIGTVEKGVDAAIVTDMIRLAWEDAYDIGVIVSSDSDLVSAVRFLDLKGLKIIQAGFPPLGADLATACWASFDLFALREEFRRPY